MNELENYRKNIDELDKNLIEILAKRFEIVKKVGEYKKENNINSLQP
jgi:chorismate mutase